MARLGRKAVAKGIGAHASDTNLSFLSHGRIPELRTLAVAPDDVHSDFVEVSYSHEHKRLSVAIHGEEKATFVFREENIMVLTVGDFDPPSFREKLRAAIDATRTSTATLVPPHSLSRG